MHRGTFFWIPFLLGGASLSVADDPQDRNLQLRGHFRNSLHQFSQLKKGTVAFMGGSITQMNGYRPMVQKRLNQRFPQTEFQWINAGISSTCSTTGAFRLQEDILGKAKVDLLFVEFAVNDDQDAGHARREAIRGMEGIVRQARQKNRAIDIVMVHFVNPGMLKSLQEGKTPISIAAHQAVAQHYAISSVHLAQELADRVNSKTMTWAEYGGTHPREAGNRLAADLCIRLLEKGWKPAGEKEPAHHALPTDRLDKGAYDGGHWVPPGDPLAQGGWQVKVPQWKQLPGQCRNQFRQEKMLVANQPGDQTGLKFNGRGIGIYVLAGPDCGQVEVSLDGGTWKTVELYHRFSRGLHYPRTVMLFTDLEAGDHQLLMRVSENRHSQSKGHGIRVLRFGVNR